MKVKVFSMKSITVITILALLLTCMFSFVAVEESYAASKKIHLRKESIALKCGDTYRQKLYDASGNVIDVSKLKFSSSNKSVATVGSKGLITAKKPGTATITVKYKGNTYKAKVTVKSRITFSKKNVTFTDDSPIRIKVMVDKNVDSVSYELTGDDIVNCSWCGRDGNTNWLEITPIGVGDTKIKITYDGKGEKYDSRQITVVCKESICEHEWKEATCTTPRTCIKCGENGGGLKGHKWSNATCTTPKTCTNCGRSEGDLGTHNFIFATCTTPHTCANCGMTKGTALGHWFKDGTCRHCGIKDYSYDDSKDNTATEPNDSPNVSTEDDYSTKLEKYNEYKTIIERKIAETRAEGPVYIGSDVEFSQRIASLSNEISSLQRKIMSLSGDSSSSAIAQKALLESQKAGLEAEMNELYAQKNRASRIKSLEAELDNYYNSLFG